MVGEAANGASALQACRQLRPDVLLLDMRLPDLDGVEVARQLQREAPGVAVVVLSAFADPDQVLAAVRAGVKGYLVKDVLGLDLKRQIRAVARGEVAMDPKVVGYLVQHMRTPERPAAQVPVNRQQLAILKLVAQGYTNKEIADQMYLSEKTIKGYLAEALRRIGAKNRVEAAMTASREGWI